jgi:hypothetical protein
LLSIRTFVILVCIVMLSVISFITFVIQFVSLMIILKCFYCFHVFSIFIINKCYVVLVWWCITEEFIHNCIKKNSLLQKSFFNFF